MPNARFHRRPPAARRAAPGPVPVALIAAALLSASLARAGDPPAVRLTVYNQDFAIVTETRSVPLDRGFQELRIADVTALLEPDSVLLRDPADPAGLRVLTQSYRSRAIGVEEMLRRYEGKTLQFQTLNPATGKMDIQAARLIRAGGGPAAGDAAAPIVETSDGRIRFSLPGEPLFERLPDDAALRPHLVWGVETAKAGRRDLELSYATGGLSWTATYNVVLPEIGDRLDLTGWVNLDNKSGASFREARVRLLAGQVHRMAKMMQQPMRLDARLAIAEAATAPAEVIERAFDEYHLYTLERPIVLEDGQTTQVEFRRASKVPATRYYVYEGSLAPAVRATVEFANTREAGLGLPLPAGTLRVFRADRDGALELVGEAPIGHLPAGETVRAEIGAAFDLVGERRALETSVVANRERAEEAYEVRLRNRRKEAVEIRVIERMHRGPTWKILEASDVYEKKDAGTIEFRVKVPAESEKRVTYRVRYTW